MICIPLVAMLCGLTGCFSDLGSTGEKDETDDAGSGDSGHGGSATTTGSGDEGNTTGGNMDTGPGEDSESTGDDNGSGGADTGGGGDLGDSGDLGDTGDDEDSSDSGDSGDTGDDEDSGDSGDTGDNEDSGNSGDSGDTGDDEDSGDTGDGGETCPGICIPPAAPGWEGPHLMHDRENGPDLPSCDGAFPSQVAEVYAGLDPGMATCTCDCGEPTGTASCSETSFLFYRGMSCNGPANLTHETFTNEQCKNLTLDDYWVTQAPEFSHDGGCEGLADSSIPTPSWTRFTRVCGGSLPTEGCLGPALCAPELVAGALHCITQAGDVSCPAGPYSEKHLRYNDFEDGRACTECTCSTVQGTCPVTFNLMPVTCGTKSIRVGFLEHPGCGHMGLVDEQSVIAIHGSPEVSGCTPIGGDLQGSAAPVSAVTVCCQP